VALLGDTKVGKSALVGRFMDHSNFMSDYVQTLIDKFTKDMLVWDNGEGEHRDV